MFWVLILGSSLTTVLLVTTVGCPSPMIAVQSRHGRFSFREPHPRAHEYWKWWRKRNGIGPKLLEWMESQIRSLAYTCQGYTLPFNFLSLNKFELKIRERKYTLDIILPAQRFEELWFFSASILHHPNITWWTYVNSGMVFMAMLLPLNHREEKKSYTEADAQGPLTTVFQGWWKPSVMLCIFTSHPVLFMYVFSSWSLDDFAVF